MLCHVLVDRVAPGEPGVHFMPVGDIVLAVMPAEIDFPAVAGA
jgi:hypothetical protein